MRYVEFLSPRRLAAAVCGHLWPRLLALRNRHHLLLDLALLPLAAWIAFWLRLDTFCPANYSSAVWAYLLATPLLKLPVLYLGGLYCRFWRYAGLGEARAIVLAAGLSAILQGLVMATVVLPLLGLGPVPRSIPFIDALLAIAVVALPRLGVRVAGRRAAQASRYAQMAASGDPRHRQPLRVLIAGAGDAGHLVIEELWSNPQLGMVPVGFVDDDRRKQGLLLRRTRVLGPSNLIPSLARQLRLDRLIIAMPSASGKTVRRLTELARSVKLPVLTMPGLYEVLSGQVEVGRLRPVQVEDLLRREPVAIDRAAVQQLFQGRRVLVTGAGGSIGSELCRQVAACGPAQLLLLGHGENSLYQAGLELSRSHPRLPLQQCVADLRDAPRIRHLLLHHRPEIVLHAAAHKHVPLMEANPEDAVTNNVVGTRNLLDSAVEAGVRHLVMISTDKAVNPTSVMGATKRVAERLVQDYGRRHGRCFVAVRFGNVLGSRGSVVPLFEEQIARGGPLTVTHPDVQRYFMTIPEAVQLVLQAAALGRCGDVFMLDMGEPVRIVDLARDMIALSGLQEGPDIDIVYTGLRPGEKLFEELCLDDECYAPSGHDKLRVLRTEGAPGPGDVAGEFDTLLQELLDVAQAGNPSGVRALLRRLVPEYAPAASPPTVAPPTVAPPAVAPPTVAPQAGPAGQPALPLRPRAIASRRD